MFMLTFKNARWCFGCHTGKDVRNRSISGFVCGKDSKVILRLFVEFCHLVRLCRTLVNRLEAGKEQKNKQRNKFFVLI